MGLVDHAEKELRRAGLFDKDSDYEGALGDAVLELVRTFAAQEHSGFSAMRTLQLFLQVAQFKPLGPITDDPEEWMDITDEPPTWQSRRSPNLFSNDGGKTYYDVDDKTRKTTASAPASAPR